MWIGFTPWSLISLPQCKQTKDDEDTKPKVRSSFAVFQPVMLSSQIHWLGSLILEMLVFLCLSDWAWSYAPVSEYLIQKYLLHLTWSGILGGLLWVRWCTTHLEFNIHWRSEQPNHEVRIAGAVLPVRSVRSVMHSHISLRLDQPTQVYLVQGGSSTNQIPAFLNTA
jgi:hypothetical protein